MVQKMRIFESQLNSTSGSAGNDRQFRKTRTKNFKNTQNFELKNFQNLLSKNLNK